MAKLLDFSLPSWVPASSCLKAPPSCLPPTLPSFLLSFPFYPASCLSISFPPLLPSLFSSLSPRMTLPAGSGPQTWSFLVLPLYPSLPAARILSLNDHPPHGTKGRSSPGFLSGSVRARSALTMALEALFPRCASLLWASLPTTRPWDSPRGLHHNTLQDRLRLLASGLCTSSPSRPPLQQPQFCRNTGYSPIQAPLLRCTSALTTSLITLFKGLSYKSSCLSLHSHHTLGLLCITPSACLISPLQDKLLKAVTPPDFRQVPGHSVLRSHMTIRTLCYIREVNRL